VSDALAVPYVELRSELTGQNQFYVDGSPTKEHKQKAWLWVAVAPLFTVFGIFGNRSRESLVSLVGNKKLIGFCKELNNRRGPVTTANKISLQSRCSIIFTPARER